MSLLQADVRQVAKKLREARVAANIKQQVIAELVGVPLSAVSQFETDSVAEPKLSLVLAYFKALGVPEGWLDRVLPQPAEDYLPESSAEAGPSVATVEELLDHLDAMAKQPDAHDMADMLLWLEGQREGVTAVYPMSRAAVLRDGGRLVWRPDPGKWEFEAGQAWAVASLDDGSDGGAA